MTLLAELPPPPTTRVRPKRWTKSEFHALVDRGALEGMPIFLFRGELIEMASMGALHALGIMNVDDWLHDTFRPDYRVRVRLPFETPGESVPEPDGAIVTHEQSARRPHPNAALLVIDVTDSSIGLDQEMAFLYAAALVPDYWLLNMRDREVEVFRDPVVDPTAPEGYRYASHRVCREGESVAPLAWPDAAVAVSALVAAPR